MARQAVVASQRYMEDRRKRFRFLRRHGSDLMKRGMVARAYDQFQKAHDTAARLIEAEPQDEQSQFMLAQSCSHLSRVASKQGNDDESRQWPSRLIQAQRRFVALPRADASILNEYARGLLTCEPADLRDPVAALPVAKKAVEKSGGKDPAHLDTLALAYFLTGDTAKAIETEEEAIALLPAPPSLLAKLFQRQETPGASLIRKQLEANLVKFRQAATSQPTSQPATTTTSEGKVAP